MDPQLEDPSLSASINKCSSTRLIWKLINMKIFIFRLTLLLGPPGSGKTTLLQALAGKPDDDLRVSEAFDLSGCIYLLTVFRFSSS